MQPSETVVKGSLVAAIGAVLAVVSPSLFAADVAWLWDDSAHVAPATSTVVRATSLLVAKGGGIGQSSPYGSEQDPFESRYMSVGRISGVVLSSKPPAGFSIMFR